MKKNVPVHKHAHLEKVISLSYHDAKWSHALTDITNLTFIQ